MTVHELKPSPYSVQLPWRPMVSAPKDGTAILILFAESGWIHAEVCGWGEYKNAPEIGAWFIFEGKPGDWESARAIDEDDYTDGAQNAVAWLPFPEWLRVWR